MKKFFWLLITLILLSFQSTSQDTLTKYGSKFSMGIDIGGGGLLGIPFRYFVTESIALELGPHARPVYNLDEDYLGLNFAAIGGPIFYINKKRRKMHGLFAKAGFSTGNRYREILGGVGWSYEKFNLFKPNRSFNIELGLGIDFLTDKTFTTSYDPYGSKTDDGKYIRPIFWWKFAWHFFIGK